MKMAIDLTKNEIAWHKENVGCSAKSAYWKESFIKGMEHLLELFEQVRQTTDTEGEERWMK